MKESREKKRQMKIDRKTEADHINSEKVGRTPKHTVRHRSVRSNSLHTVRSMVQTGQGTLSYATAYGQRYKTQTVKEADS
jgi:hypothetical protein